MNLAGGHQVFLGLGSNLGNCQENLMHACKEIERQIGTIIRQSAFHTTEPWGFQTEHVFLNAVVWCTTILSPRELLLITQQIEHEMGRNQKSENGKYHDRIIDIDVLFYDELVVDEPDLRIPHPLMKQRDFVMLPLMEIIPKDSPLLQLL